MDLTERQIQIIRCLIEEYSETAEPVGSDMLDKKYNLSISPATIRNEMAVLTKKGFLRQPHTSAGRVPTAAAIKFYINQLMREQQLSVAEEVAVKERVWDSRDELGRLLGETTRLLSERTGLLSLASTDDQRLYHSGYARILDLPEFFDIDITRQVLRLVEEINHLNAIFSRAHGDELVHILLGDDLEEELLRPLCFVFTNFTLGPRHGRLGIIGPARLNYGRVVPFIRYLNQLFSNINSQY